MQTGEEIKAWLLLFVMCGRCFWTSVGLSKVMPCDQQSHKHPAHVCEVGAGAMSPTESQHGDKFRIYYRWSHKSGQRDWIL